MAAAGGVGGAALGSGCNSDRLSTVPVSASGKQARPGNQTDLLRREQVEVAGPTVSRPSAVNDDDCDLEPWVTRPGWISLRFAAGSGSTSTAGEID